MGRGSDDDEGRRRLDSIIRSDRIIWDPIVRGAKGWGEKIWPLIEDGIKGGKPKPQSGGGPAAPGGGRNPGSGGGRCPPDLCAAAAMGTDPPPGSSSGHRRHDIDLWLKHIWASRVPRVTKDPHESAVLFQRFRQWIVYICTREGGTRPGLGGKRPGSSGGMGGKIASAEAAPGGTGTTRTVPWSRAPCYRSYTRAEVLRMEKEMKEAAFALNKCTKMSKQMRQELDRLTKLVEEYGNMLKFEVQNQLAAMNLSSEESAQLKKLVDELKEAMKAQKAGRWFNLTKLQEAARVPMDCGRLATEMSFYALLVGGVLVLLGYVELDEPAPFNPRETRAGKLLYDNFNFGLRVNSSCSVGFTHATLTSILSGELDDLQSEMFIRRVEESWRCQLGILPGPDVVLKGRMEDIWLKGLKLDFNLPFYDGAQRTLVFKQKHRFGSVGGTVGLNANPLLSLTAMFGTKQLSGGCIVDYEAVPGIVRRVALGGVVNLMGVSTSVMMEKLLQAQAPGQQQPQQPQANYQITSTLHVQASEATSVGAEMIHHMENHVTTVQAGVQHTYADSGTTVKCRLSNQLMLAGMLQQKVGEKSYISICSMVNLWALHANPRVGLSISIGY